jgi:hypothetical protein
MYLGSSELWLVRSPNVAVLSQQFAAMEFNTRALYFSDDSCLSLRVSRLLPTGERVASMLYVNIDISGCDSSNGDAVFQSLLDFCPDSFREHVVRAIEQCSLPVVLGFGKGKVTAAPKSLFEYSGSVLTTFLNNVASMAILVHVLRGVVDGMDEVEARKAVEDRLENCGWKCTAEWCSHYSQLQFLKHSPHRCESGNVRACLNLGVVLRAMGRTDGDYPGRGPLLPRIDAFNRQWVAGLAHAGTHLVTRALRERWPLLSEGRPLTQRQWSSNVIYQLQDQGDYLDHDPILTTSLCDRYGTQVGELEELASLLEQAGIGDLMGCSAATVILSMDYGLSTP